MSIIENFEALLAKGQDTALLRYGLGNAYLNAGDAVAAVTHLAQAVAQDPEYTAAWKIYGKALAAAGDPAAAAAAYEQGIAVSERTGDIQAGKEMRVFLKRLRKEMGDEPK